ncbi:hypothetical protein OVY48_09850 [Sphingobium sp. SA2]|uniref:hypothetical protein n=1 Tax=Sphingobium sp. SA2 TaxID=1524832 RepID=UPI0028BF7C67|nr:hypothetical protein [Sphingobium sp. SA2]MDT7533726.1 hypothetical protein [Sphingobium sp. SA2]
MMRYYLLDDAYHASAQDVPLPGGAIVVPRLPIEGERWDGDGFVCDDEIAADMAVPSDHVARAHMVKQVEAVLILSGWPLTHGLLAEEAAANGLDINLLAQRVLDNAAAFRARESARRSRKWQARAGGDA